MFLIMRLRRSAMLAVAIATAGAIAALPVGEHSARSGFTVEASCGQPILQSTTLLRDLVCPAGGPSIGADRLTLDLNGHSIVGTGSNASIGIDVGSHRRTTVRGGSIRGFATGVRLDGAWSTAIVGDSFIDNRHYAIAVLRSGASMIMGNRARHAGGAPGFAAVYLYRSDDNVVARNSLSHMGAGIALSHSSLNLIVANSASDNIEGISLVRGSSGNLVAGNQTDRNADSGILIDRHANANRIEHNRASRNVFAGIAVGASDRSTVRANIADSNLGSGIAIVDRAQGTRVEGNQAHENGSAPYGCSPRCPYLDDGIHVDAPDTIISSNSADRNADRGIDAVRSVTDGAGNEAHGNRNRAQCAAVTCRQTR